MSGSFDAADILDAAEPDELSSEGSRSGYDLYIDDSDEWAAIQDGEMIVGEERRDVEATIDARSDERDLAVDRDTDFGLLDEYLDGEDFYSVVDDPRIDAELWGEGYELDEDESELSIVTIHRTEREAEQAVDEIRGAIEQAPLPNQGVEADGRAVRIFTSQSTWSIGTDDDPSDETVEEIIDALSRVDTGDES